jgi:hypothetical protein
VSIRAWALCLPVPGSRCVFNKPIIFAPSISIPCSVGRIDGNSNFSIFNARLCGQRLHQSTADVRSQHTDNFNTACQAIARFTQIAQIDRFGSEVEIYLHHFDVLGNVGNVARRWVDWTCEPSGIVTFWSQKRFILKSHPDHFQIIIPAALSFKQLSRCCVLASRKGIAGSSK